MLVTGTFVREVAPLDGPGPFDEAPEGPDQALRAGGAEAESGHHRHREEDQVQAEDALLLRVGGLGRGPGQLGQLGAHRGQVRAERLLELLEPQRQGARIGGAAGGVGAQHLVAEGEVGRL